jgi:hypothetical protein
MPNGFFGFGGFGARLYRWLASEGKNVVELRIDCKCEEEKSIGACLYFEALDPAWKSLLSLKCVL